jgi:serine/threonine protein kinase
MGLEVVNLIERMHSIGVVHGDLNEFKVRIQANGELCLIDFESAVFIPETDRTARSSFPQSSAEYLSPWEIQGFPYARRDDLFRWVEMLARLLYGEPFSNYQRTESFATIDGLLRFKLANMYFNMKGGRRRNIWSVLTNEGKHLAKGALNTVLAYVRTLGQETLPDYGFIYQKIESVIQILP